ncbi:MAG TPA: hypothetical protein VIJ78_01415 [Pseudolabrys sp.]
MDISAAKSVAMPNETGLGNCRAAPSALSLNAAFFVMPDWNIDIARVFVAKTSVTGEDEGAALLEGLEIADFLDIVEAGIDRGAPAGVPGRGFRCRPWEE